MLSAAVCYAARMNTDTKWIVGTGVGIVLAMIGTGVTLGLLLSAQIAGVNARIDDVRDDLTTNLSAQIAGINARIDDVRDDLRDMRATMDGFDTRLRNVEIAFGKVDQRLLIIERFVLPTPEQPAE